MKTYSIRILRPAPSMDQDRHLVEAASYQEAVEATHAAWRSALRSTALYAGEHGTYWYHHIDSAGIARDRNTNSGVPAEQVIQ